MKLQYQRSTQGGEERCTAFITNLQLVNGNEIELAQVKRFQGYVHVTDVNISSSIIYGMPEIGKNFRNLFTLSIVDCGLVKISKKNFEQLNKLKGLNLADNLIESLPADLFELVPQLTCLTLRNNRIKFISQHTLAPLTCLSFADFRGNITINEIYDSTEQTSSDRITLCMLRAKIFVQCKPPNEQIPTVVTQYVHCLWQGLFSDFKIKAREEVFEVHKAVLAANSPVFAAMFSHQMEENLKNEMTIAYINPESVKELLAFVYLREVPHNCFNATELYALAHEYQINELSEQIQWHISMKVNRKNATEMLKFGVLYNNEIIKQAAFQAIEESLNRKLPERLLESVEGLMDLIDVKDKLDENLERLHQIESRQY